MLSVSSAFMRDLLLLLSGSKTSYLPLWFVMYLNHLSTVCKHDAGKVVTSCLSCSTSKKQSVVIRVADPCSNKGG